MQPQSEMLSFLHQDKDDST